MQGKCDWQLSVTKGWWKWRHGLLTILISTLLMGGCGRAYADPATLAATLEPTAVFAELTSANSLPAAGEQFAAALNIDPAGVRVRIKPGSCIVCTVEANPEISSVNGISVAEAEKLVGPNDEVSFFIPKFSCTFRYDGETLIPQQCQPSPI